MRVLVAGELFRAELTLDLVALFRLSKDGRHRVLPEDFEDPRFQSWLAARDPDLRHDLEEALYGGVKRETLEKGFGPEIRALFRDPEVLKRPDWFQADGGHKEPADVARRILSLV